MSASTPRPCMSGRVEPTSLEEQPKQKAALWTRWGLRTSRRMAAAVWPLRCRDARCSALSESLWQQAGAEGAAAAAGTPPVRMMSSHGLALSNSLRFLRGQLREFLRECAAADVEVTMYDAGEGGLYPTEQWTVHFFKWLRACV